MVTNGMMWVWSSTHDDHRYQIVCIGKNVLHIEGEYTEDAAIRLAQRQLGRKISIPQGKSDQYISILVMKDGRMVKGFSLPEEKPKQPVNSQDVSTKDT